MEKEAEAHLDGLEAALRSARVAALEQHDAATTQLSSSIFLYTFLFLNLARDGRARSRDE
jgi:hypothetical protein